MKLFIRWLVIAIAVMIGAYLLPGVEVSSFWAALVTAVVLGLINLIVKPIVLVLTLPVNVLTLGLFTFVINALMIMLAAEIVPGFEAAGFWPALLFSLVLSLLLAVFNTALDD